ncbi:MAG: hypothetical protein E7541_02935 [Ruminococcaceae bacterium]|nr:hypothetical protein [Oscillospiraceae bacterium]
MQRYCKMCELSFEPRNHRQIYCSPGCAQLARRLNNRRYEENKKNKRSAPAVTVDQVLAFAQRYAAATGRYPHYGEAVRLMEKGVTV